MRQPAYETAWIALRDCPMFSTAKQRFPTEEAKFYWRYEYIWRLGSLFSTQCVSTCLTNDLPHHWIDNAASKLIFNKLTDMTEKEVDKSLRADLGVSKEELKQLKKKLAKIEPRSERGAETLFRLVSKNQYSLKSMIDRKARILILGNTLILSIILGTVLEELQNDPHLIYPIIVMLITNVFSIAFAIFATRPELKHGDIETNNLLFYGNFNDMEEDEYVEKITGLMYQGDELYKTIAKDTFYLGKVIDRQFKFLRTSFNVFLVGIAVAVSAFVMCHALFAELF